MLLYVAFSCQCESEKDASPTHNHDISDSEESDDGEAGERVVSSIQLVLIDCTGCVRARDP